MKIIEQMTALIEQAQSDGVKPTTWNVRVDLIPELEAAAIEAGVFGRTETGGGMIYGIPYKPVGPDSGDEVLLWYLVTLEDLGDGRLLSREAAIRP